MEIEPESISCEVPPASPELPHTYTSLRSMDGEKAPQVVGDGHGPLNPTSEEIGPSPSPERPSDSANMCKERVAILGMSPGFKTDVVRMNSYRELHEDDYEVVTISEHPNVEGHLCADFSSARGWNTILEGFFTILYLDYSWIQRDYFYTNYGGKRWFYDQSVPGNTGFIKRFFEWNGQVIILPLDERGDVWKEFSSYQHLNKFDYQLFCHEASPLVQASRFAENVWLPAENKWQWLKELPKEFQCKTDRNQRRYLRATLEGSEDMQSEHRHAAEATHIAFTNGTSGANALERYLLHNKAEFARMATNYSNPTGKPPPSTAVVRRSAAAAAAEIALSQPISIVQWVQCDECSKWRSIPAYVDSDALPDQWFCEMNEWDSERNHCGAAEIVGDEPKPGAALPVSSLSAAAVSSLSMAAQLPPLLPPASILPPQDAAEGTAAPVLAPFASPPGFGEDSGQLLPDLPPPMEMVEIPADIEAILRQIPPNFPPAEPVKDTAPSQGCGQRTITNCGNKHSPRAASSRTKRAVGGSAKKDKDSKVLVNIGVEALPPAGTLMIEDWIQCEKPNCEKWHQVGPGVLDALKDVIVTCTHLGLECVTQDVDGRSKITKNKKPKIKSEVKEAEQQTATVDPMESWAPCAFDDALVKCNLCGRLSSRRDAMRGKPCQCHS